MTPTEYAPKQPGDFLGKTRKIAAVLFGKLATLRQTNQPVRWLFCGPPGTGKSRLAEILALELAQHPLAIEHLNGQSLTIDLVRDWRKNSCYRPLYGHYSVKLIDEIDAASLAAQNELRTHLDKLPPCAAVIGTTNLDLSQMQSQLQTRMTPQRFTAVPAKDIAALLKTWAPEAKAREIADNCNGCVRSALIDTEAWMDATTRAFAEAL